MTAQHRPAHGPSGMSPGSLQAPPAGRGARRAVQLLGLVLALGGDGLLIAAGAGQWPSSLTAAVPGTGWLPTQARSLAVVVAITAGLGTLLCLFARSATSSTSDPEGSDHDALLSFADILSACTDAVQVARHLTSFALEAGGARRCALLLGSPEGEKGHRSLALVTGPEETKVDEPNALPVSDLVRRALEAGRPLHHRNPSGRTDGWISEQLPGARHVVVFPVRLTTGACGGLIVEYGGSLHAASAAPRGRVQILSLALAHAALAFDRAAVLGPHGDGRGAAGRTAGCVSRTAFDQALRDQIAAAESGAEPFSVALIGVDRLTPLENGDTEADPVLMAPAIRTLRNTCRATDLIGEYRPGVLAILMPGATLHVVEAAAQRLRSAVVACTFDVPVVVSIGAAAYPEHAAAGSLIGAAKQALARARAMTPALHPTGAAPVPAAPPGAPSVAGVPAGAAATPPS
jgi:diguanylate cyclase (GGDEF)-like protein